MIFTVAFWKGAGERLLKTFLQAGIAAFLGTLGLGATTGSGFNALANLGVLAQASEIGAGFGLGAAILSLCTSLGNAQFTAGQPAAVVQQLQTTPAPVVNVNTAPTPVQPVAVESAPEPTPALEPEPVPESEPLAQDLGDDDAEDDVLDEQDPADLPETAPETSGEPAATTA